MEETTDLRVPEVCRVQLAHLGRQERGAVMELMVPGVCQESRGVRGTEDSTGYQVSPERRDTGVSWVPSALQVLQERMGREARTVRSDNVVWQEKADLEVCLALGDHQGLVDNVVSLD